MQLNEDEIISRGLSLDEYNFLKKQLGREPKVIEVGIAGAMWSEHCSYKSSKIYLKKFPTKGEYVLIGPGENAGVIDIDDGMVGVFKMESHNHPSFIEPYQGAATGVGGILRDVFTMGARPVLNLNALFFGHPDYPKTKYLLNGVVKGVGDYGNCVGVPTCGGQTTFDECYNTNNLVNAFTFGIGKKDKIFLGAAKGIGNPVFYVGSKTGRDGIHGATMASASFDENYEEERPAVQVGDPFTEKLLLEACLELMDKDIIEGIQDMGAAGLTSSAFEMSDRGNVGLRLYLDRVPVREKMMPEEIMLSESQERMLIIAKKGKEADVKAIFDKWQLDATVIGEVIGSNFIELYFNGNLEAKINVPFMVSSAPAYDRPHKKPDYIDKVKAFNFDNIKEPENYNSALLQLVSCPDLSDKHLLYEQYDATVQTNTILRSPHDAAVLRIKETGKGVAATVDVNPRFVYLDPYKGSQLAFLEAFRNLVTVGAHPVALTDCLNFGSPENPYVMWQFKQSAEGLSKACIALDVPVVSGNVSFYNETSDVDIYPTPTIGMVGLMDDPHQALSINFKSADNSLYIIGKIEEGELGGSAYLKWIHNTVKGKIPAVDFQTHRKLLEFIRETKASILSAHDISDGGLAIAVAEMCMTSDIGARININYSARPDFYLFSETQGVIVIETKEDEMIIKAAKKAGISVEKIGTTGGDSMKINDIVDIKIDTLKKENNKFFAKMFY